MSHWKPDLAERYSSLVDEQLDEVTQTIFGDNSNPQKLLLIEQRMIGLVREGVVRAEWISKELYRINHGSESADESWLDRLIVDLNDLSDLMISLREEVTECPLFELRCEFNGLIKSHSLYRQP